MTVSEILAAPGKTAYSLLFRYRTFVKYCIVGTSVTAVDFLVFSLAFYGLRLGSIPSKLVAFCCAVVVSYIFNRIWTFRSQEGRIPQQFSRFSAVSIVGATFSGGLIYLLIDVLAIHPLLANAITSCVVLTWNFLANKYWTFRASRTVRCSPSEATCHLSLVIPAYNEEHRIGRTLDEDLEYLAEQPYSWEIIVADDGSKDETVPLVRQYCARSGNRIRLIRLPRNMGKGAAVQMGVVNATGRFIIIADADNATPIQEVGRFLTEAKDDEIIIGSRYIASSQIDRRQSNARILIGRLGNLLIRLFLINGIEDTQCGFKLFPSQIAHDLFSRQRVSGWGFDMEILSVAQNMGMTIREKGVVWRDVPGSRLRPIRASFRTLLELAVIKINLWSGIYD